jgi:hypothetical protein
VTDPAKAGQLALTAVYRGGIAAYLNGKEFHRGHLAAGKIEPGSPAGFPPRSGV